MLEHILMNLVGNAIKYSPAGSDVTVQIRREGDTAVISVSDRGIGIPESDVVRIFQPFHRGQNVGSRSGSGLGLPIVKQSLDALGGEISVKSRVGQGTTFTVRIPGAAGLD
jgi:signal transduction histidine kinase